MPWKLTGVFHGYEEKDNIVSEVVDILDMWSFIESSYKKLTQKEKKCIKDETGYDDITFVGFDGNNEIEHMNIAEFLINDLERFQSFKGKYMNSHSPSLEGHRRMLKIFLPMRPTLVGGKLSASQIIELVKTKWTIQR